MHKTKEAEQDTGNGRTWSVVANALSAFLILVWGVPVHADGNEQASFGWAGTYAGGFGGFSRTDNQIEDVDGFANWGNPGYTVDYDDSGFIGGALIGKRFHISALPLRVEIDGSFGDLSASSNRLDPVGLDETVRSELDWVATARAGIEHDLGSATLFVSGGLALARIDNSVTDIDFGPNRPTEVDPDDSFSDSATEIGWVISLGIEAPLPGDWTARMEGSWMNLGRDTHYVNRSGDGRCGPGMVRRPCPYTVKNELGLLRLAIIRRF